MFKRFLPTALIGYLFVVIVNWGCTKLDTTGLGSDLIPVVDNVNTFRDTLDILSTQGIFDDTFKITTSVSNVLGSINNDVLFGSTKADMYVQMKPLAFPYYFGGAGDTLVAVDSVVLCLAYAGAWGDTNSLQQLQVYQVDNQGFADSPTNYRNIKYQPGTFPTPISPIVSVDIRKLDDTIRLRKDSVINQIRLKLDATFAQQLFTRDSLPAAGNNAFRTDSIFRRFYNGFAIKSMGGTGNALMYISLTDARSRLEVYYKRKLSGTGVLDTTRSSFSVLLSETTNNLRSASSNYVERSYSGNVTAPSPNQLYMMTGPGTYANLKILNLENLSNRIVHRAEIYMEQDPDNATQDSIFSPPSYMYLDLVDTGTTKWKPLYYDLNPNESYDPDYKKPFFPYYPVNSGVNFGYFGGFARWRYNYLGQKVVYYTINITRHVQQIVTKGTPNYTMRLFPAYNFSYPQYTAGLSTFLGYNNPLANGRIRLKSGSYPDENLKMKMIITWSKVN